MILNSVLWSRFGWCTHVLTLWSRSLLIIDPFLNSFLLSSSDWHLLKFWTLRSALLKSRWHKFTCAISKTKSRVRSTRFTWACSAVRRRRFTSSRILREDSCWARTCSSDSLLQCFLTSFLFISNSTRKWPLLRVPRLYIRVLFHSSWLFLGWK